MYLCVYHALHLCRNYSGETQVKHKNNNCIPFIPLLYIARSAGPLSVMKSFKAWPFLSYPSIAKKKYQQTEQNGQIVKDLFSILPILPIC